MPVLAAWIVSILLAALGVRAVYWSLELDGREQWLSNLLANIGPTLVLAAPLSMLAFLLDRAAKATNKQLDRLSLSLEQLQSESDELRERVFEKENQLFSSISTGLSFESLVDSLKTATARGYVSNHGIRVPFIYGQNHVRFYYRKPGLLRRAKVWLYVERDNGEPISHHTWKSNRNVRAFFAELSKHMERGGHLPNDFDATAPFKALSELLVFTARCKHNYHASAIEGSPVLGGIDDWVFIDRGLFPKDASHYCIGWERLDEMDWLRQIDGKPWQSRESFPMAHHIAQEWYPRLEGIRAPKPKPPTSAN